jgi:hypothetical protein
LEEDEETDVVLSEIAENKVNWGSGQETEARKDV